MRSDVHTDSTIYLPRVAELERRISLSELVECELVGRVVGGDQLAAVHAVLAQLDDRFAP
jgi:hypothetical protein